jgi:hypothetical protein
MQIGKIRWFDNLTLVKPEYQCKLELTQQQIEDIERAVFFHK